MPALWDEAKVCEYLAITPRHLQNLRYRRELPFVKVGGKVRFRPAEIEAWIDARTVEAAS